MYYAILSAEFGFADDTSRVVTFEPYNASSLAVAGFKQRVKNFNSTIPSSFQSTFLSNDGASCTGIISASVTSTEKTVIFAKSAEYAARAVESGDSNGNG